MCTNASALIPYGIKVPNPAGGFTQFTNGMTQAAFDYHRAQLYDYTRLAAYGIRGYPAGAHHALTYHPHAQDQLAHAFLYNKHDPRARFIHEEPKPSHSYIGLIAMAILSVRDNKLVLSDIYQWILDNYAYFRTRGPGWRNSIRHNLSLNDCFIKSGRSANGKGHYWAIHPANVEDFKKGDFRRRRAQRRVRKHMGLSVPDDEDSPTPPPVTATPPSWQNGVLVTDSHPDSQDSNGAKSPSLCNQRTVAIAAIAPPPPKKRMFDVESLLAPDNVDIRKERDIQTHSPNSVVTDLRVDRSIGHCSPMQDRPEDLSEDRRSPVSIHGQLSPHSEDGRRSAQDSPNVIRASPRDDLQRGWPVTVPAIPAVWREGPSAFHSANPATAIAWSTLSPHGYPIMSAPYPLPAVPHTIDSAQQWQETFSKIMARSYDKNPKVEIS
ncbi:forkhead box protein C1-like [Lineus longissimus]|uniref:forkhead box protein C1-like n=1 Tax=Lineus longissimus TaxID=88925 RepID=UPI00315CAB8D